MIKKKKLFFVKKELKSQKNAKECYICGNEIQKILKIYIIERSEFINIMQGNTEAQQIVFVI